MYNLKEIRKNRRISQEELSQKSGVSRTIIGRLESEKEYVTTTTTLVALAKALDVTVGEIFF